MSDITALKIKNWERFQHFKDRRPPWIKLHREILEQRDINMLSDCSFRVLIGLWLIASDDRKMEGNLPPITDIAFRLRMTIPNINKALKELSPFLCQGDIKVISEGYQVDEPEKRREEKRREEEKRVRASFFNDFYLRYPKKTTKKETRDFCLTKLDINEELDKILEALDVQIKHKESLKEKGEFAPEFQDPIRWLKKKRWEDEITVVPDYDPAIERGAV